MRSNGNTIDHRVAEMGRTTLHVYVSNGKGPRDVGRARTERVSLIDAMTPEQERAWMEAFCGLLPYHPRAIEVFAISNDLGAFGAIDYTVTWEDGQREQRVISMDGSIYHAN